MTLNLETVLPRLLSDQSPSLISRDEIWANPSDITALHHKHSPAKAYTLYSESCLSYTARAAVSLTHKQSDNKESRFFAVIRLEGMIRWLEYYINLISSQNL